MRYLHTNDDGSVGVWATIPIKIIREDSLEFKVLGVRRRKGRCYLYGGWANGLGEEIDVGDDSTDVSDLASDTLPGYTLVFPEFDKDILAKLHPDLQVRIVGSRPIVRKELMNDYTFRGAWIDTGTKIDVDMVKARDIWRDKMREARAPILADLDTQYLKADETADTQLKTTIVEQKQVLRDITAIPEIEAAETPEALKAIWPAELG